MDADLQTSTRDALAAIGLPARQDLDDARQRGRVCLWCAAELTGGSAVDLGQQTDSSGRHWFPRACRRDAAARAKTALFDHVGICEQCTYGSDLCEVGRVLYRLIRQEWR
ncbi:hypothetical protein ACIQPQ_35855 [Streptomyces sp. NPDC091281]|uniref:hypothetical protein n=1 Tax=Streptomyces sp. NPDC091281 TaxID=3365985 RepID=UPI003817C5BB